MTPSRHNQSNAINNLRCKAVVRRNVRSFKWAALGRGKRIMRSPLFVFPLRPFSQPRLRHEERLSRILDSCLAVQRHTERGQARSFNRGNKCGQGESALGITSHRDSLNELTNSFPVRYNSPMTMTPLCARTTGHLLLIHAKKGNNYE